MPADTSTILATSMGWGSVAEADASATARRRPYSPVRFGKCRNPGLSAAHASSPLSSAPA